jgi:hypothetical protein
LKNELTFRGGGNRYQSGGKPPHSRRYRARCASNILAKRLECGVFSTALPNGSSPVSRSSPVKASQAWSSLVKPGQAWSSLVKALFKKIFSCRADLFTEASGEGGSPACETKAGQPFPTYPTLPQPFLEKKGLFISI